MRQSVKEALPFSNLRENSIISINLWVLGLYFIKSQTVDQDKTKRELRVYFYIYPLHAGLFSLPAEAQYLN